MTDNLVEFVVSGGAWIGSGFGSIETALHNLFNLANDEVVFVAYTISSATPSLFRQVEYLLERGVRVRMLINRYEEQHASVRASLSLLYKQFYHLLHLFSFLPEQGKSDLHAKIVLIDRKYALVSSANLSQRGLMGNYEIVLRLKGEAVADITRATDLLFSSTQTLPILTF